MVTGTFDLPQKGFSEMRVAVIRPSEKSPGERVAFHLTQNESARDSNVTYVDCRSPVDPDNPGQFITDSRVARQNVVTIDTINCLVCGECTEVCPTGALERGEDRILIHSDRCVACNCCVGVCPTDALSRSSVRAGQIHLGNAGDLRVITGSLDSGESDFPALIRTMKRIAASGLVIFDAQPGLSATTAETIKNLDGVVIVTGCETTERDACLLLLRAVCRLQLPAGVVLVGGSSEPPWTDEITDAGGVILTHIPETVVSGLDNQYSDNAGHNNYLSHTVEAIRSQLHPAKPQRRRSWLGELFSR